MDRPPANLAGIMSIRTLDTGTFHRISPDLAVFPCLPVFRDSDFKCIQILIFMYFLFPFPCFFRLEKSTRPPVDMGCDGNTSMFPDLLQNRFGLVSYHGMSISPSLCFKPNIIEKGIQLFYWRIDFEKGDK